MVPSVSKQLVEKDGIWYAPVQAELSYPEDANDLYFAIEDGSFWFRHRNNCLTHLVKQHAGDRIFHDIGGGNGAVTLAIQRTGIPAVLIEPGIKGCQNARKRGVENVVCAVFQSALDPDHPIASAGMFDVLEHIEDEQSFLKDLHGRMAVGGKLFVTVPAFNMLWSEEDDQVGHYRRYTLASLERVLSDAGFKAEYGTYLFSFLPLPIFLMRSLPTKLGIRRAYNDPETVTKEHGGSSTPKAVELFLNWELNRVRKGKRISVGSSCLMVLTRV